jgi:hypothetical protein
LWSLAANAVMFVINVAMMKRSSIIILPWWRHL